MQPLCSFLCHIPVAQAARVGLSVLCPRLRSGPRGRPHQVQGGQDTASQRNEGCNVRADPLAPPQQSLPPQYARCLRSDEPLLRLLS